MTPTAVKLLIEKCGRCGGDVVGDNTMTGRPWQHVDRPDDHPIIFGTPAPPLDLTVRPATLEDLEGLLEEGEALVGELPPPGTPRAAADDEVPTGAARVVKKARAAGFETVQQIVTGPIHMARHHDPRGYRYVDSLLVGFRHEDGRIAIAIWERQETETAFKYKWAMFPDGHGLASSVALKAYLQ